MIVQPSLALMLTDLMFCSWETMVRRAMMMAQGHCSATEYQRMLLEKRRAAHLSGLAMAFLGLDGNVAAVIAPWHIRATSNVRRLRKQRIR